MKKHVFLVCLVIVSIFVAGCSNETLKDEKETVELSVSVASSLTNAMEELQSSFQQEYPEVTFTVNFGSSGKLAQQIQQGAPVDIFLSADQKWMNTLEEENLIVADTRQDFTGNKLVLIASKESDISITSFEEIEGDTVGQIAIGDPESVPAGTYTKEVLENLGIWEKLKSNFVYGSDVTQVLTYVESGNTDIGFVYLSDALLSDQVKVLAEANSTLHTPIIYPSAVLSDSQNPDIAKKFIEFLLEDNSQEILSKYGFTK